MTEMRVMVMMAMMLACTTELSGYHDDAGGDDAGGVVHERDRGRPRGHRGDTRGNHDLGLDDHADLVDVEADDAADAGAGECVPSCDLRAHCDSLGMLVVEVSRCGAGWTWRAHFPGGGCPDRDFPGCEFSAVVAMGCGAVEVEYRPCDSLDLCRLNWGPTCP